MLGGLLTCCSSSSDVQKYVEQLPSHVEEMKHLKDELQVQRKYFESSSQENAPKVITSIDDVSGKIDIFILKAQKTYQDLHGKTDFDDLTVKAAKEDAKQTDRTIEKVKSVIATLQEKSGVH